MRLPVQPRLWHPESMTIREKNIGSKEPATKGDLEQLREDLQADMTRMEGRITDRFSAIDMGFSALEERITRESENLSKMFDDWGRTLFEKIDIAVENRQIELGAAKAEHVLNLDDKVRELDDRVGAIERQDASRRDQKRGT